MIFGDKAYNDYDFEDLLAEADDINLSPIRKKNAKRGEPAYVEYLQYSYHKQIETAGSKIERKLRPRFMQRASEGFELKVFLFVLSLSFDSIL